MERMPHHIIRGTTRTVPRVWDELARPTLVGAVDAGIGTVGTVGLGSLALTKMTVEYGAVKPLWWGIRGLGWLGAHGINFVTREKCGEVPRPTMNYFNFPGHRPRGMNWFWDRTTNHPWVAHPRVPWLRMKHVPEWDNLWRYGLVGTAGTVQGAVALGLTVGAIPKQFVEYGVVRPFVFYPAKLLARGIIEGYNKVNNAGGGARGRLGTPDIPDGKYFPRVGPKNVWKYGGLRGRTNDPWARLRLANWIRDANDRDTWALDEWWSWLHPKHLEPFKAPLDTFDKTKIYEPGPRTPRWYQEYRKWISEEVVKEIEKTFKYYLTPLKDAAGTNYVHTDGTNVVAVAGGGGEPSLATIRGNGGAADTAGDNAKLTAINNAKASGVLPPVDVANNAFGTVAAANNYYANNLNADQRMIYNKIGTDAYNKAALKELSKYYPDPEMWIALNDPATQLNTIAGVIDNSVANWKQNHLELNELRKWKETEKLLEELQDELDKFHALAEFLRDLAKGTASFKKGLYGFDDALMGLPFKVIDVVS